MDTTTATVIVHSDRPEPLIEDIVGQAKSIFESCRDLNNFYIDCEAQENDSGEPEVHRLSSDEGSQHLSDQLEKTIETRASYLENLVEKVQNADDIEAAAQDKSVFRLARDLGTWYSPSTAFLYDGTGWARGSPITSLDQLENTTERHDPENVYLVPVRMFY